MSEYEYASNPIRYDNNSINLTVKFYNIESLIPFLASEDDLNETSRELYARAVSGDFGEVQVSPNAERETNLKNTIDKISEKREYLMLNGGCKVGEHWFQSTIHNKLQQMGLFLLGENVPDDIYWTTLSGERILVTPELLQQIYTAQLLQEKAIFAYGDLLIDQAKAAEHPECLDIDSGWPETFNG